MKVVPGNGGIVVTFVAGRSNQIDFFRTGDARVDPIEQGTFIPPGALGVGVFNGTYPAADTNQTDWKFQAIPEPSTYALVGLGALGMMGLRRRIKR